MDANQFVADEEDNTYSCRASGKFVRDQNSELKIDLHCLIIITNEVDSYSLVFLCDNILKLSSFQVYASSTIMVGMS